MQLATTNQVVLSFLFDTELELQQTDPRRLKTCFVDSFEFSYFAAAMNAKPPRDPGELVIPLKELITYMNDSWVFYEGSMTIPPC